jgi:uncharacterized membrane protein YfcA
VGILIGAGFGALTAEAISGPHLQKIIGVFALVIAVQLALDLKPRPAARCRAGRSDPGGHGDRLGFGDFRDRRRFADRAVPDLAQRADAAAVATSSACGLPIALASALSFMILGWHDPLLPAHSQGSCICRRCWALP